MTTSDTKVRVADNSDKLLSLHHGTDDAVLKAQFEKGMNDDQKKAVFMEYLLELDQEIRNSKHNDDVRAAARAMYERIKDYWENSRKSGAIDDENMFILLKSTTELIKAPLGSKLFVSCSDSFGKSISNLKEGGSNSITYGVAAVLISALALAAAAALIVGAMVSGVAIPIVLTVFMAISATVNVYAFTAGFGSCARFFQQGSQSLSMAKAMGGLKGALEKEDQVQQKGIKV